MAPALTEETRGDSLSCVQPQRGPGQQFLFWSGSEIRGRCIWRVRDRREHSRLMYDGFSIIRTVLKWMRLLLKMKRGLLTLGKSPTAAKRPPVGEEVPALSRAQVSPGKLSPPRHVPLAFAQPTESATETESGETGNVRTGRPWEIIHVSISLYRWEH